MALPLPFLPAPAPFPSLLQCQLCKGLVLYSAASALPSALPCSPLPCLVCPCPSPALPCPAMPCPALPLFCPALPLPHGSCCPKPLRCQSDAPTYALLLLATHTHIYSHLWLQQPKAAVARAIAKRAFSHSTSAWQVEMHQRPGTLLEGEMHRCCLSMRNSGASPLHNVRMIISHPDVYCPTSDEDLQTDVATALSGSSTPLCS